ncbi:uncharacterized protein LOC123534396 [Mercenaria mercenaria]|uniref:uncharacterized protein LOC123534396 n=1 Tax=Mercenaria mercenaria TaxID=6596 RepID=UPI00234F4701|nr:uncharacterized protein LOC123534396 [Mercenaria mercenaria]
MAAPTKADAGETKGKTNSWQYAQHIEPSEEVLKFYVEQINDCGIYRTEYEECVSWRGRRNQKFVYGLKLDCEHLKGAQKTCEHYKKTGDVRARDYLVTYERSKRDFRMQNARANDVWEYRMTPYGGWSSPVQKVSKEEINPEDDFIPARLNLNQNNPETANKNDKPRDKPEIVRDQSNEKGSNSKVEILKKIEDNSSSDNKKGWCVIS